MYKDVRLNQIGAAGPDDKPNPPFIPVVVNNKPASGSPFITRTATEVYNKGRPPRDDTFGKETKTSGPALREQREFVKDLRESRPAIKLEVFEKDPQPVPQGFVHPYIIAEKGMLGTTLHSSPADFKYLTAPTSALSLVPFTKIPLQHVYNINLPGPTGGHVELNRIVENILPGKELSLTSTTLGERLQMYNYVRSILIKYHDGEDISVDSKSNGQQRNLMSYLKFLEINPNHYSPISSNPYKGLPLGLLIYRSCFPIKLDERTNRVVCARESIGLNIRLYCLTLAEYYSWILRQVIYKEYDVWRELSYYEYIRENILKKKESPHFPLLYSFFLSHDKKIDFLSLKKNCLTQRDVLTKEWDKFVKAHRLRYNLMQMLGPGVVRQVPPTAAAMSTDPNHIRSMVTPLPDEKDPELQAYSGTTLIMVTEAPHHNMYQWASRIYNKEGIVEKMISHGFHTEQVWYSILFQLASALYVMQKHGIYMRNMTIHDNVYIKDLQVPGKPVGYWVYIINGISYYVPNHGYVVIVDSNFKDINPETRTLGTTREFKVYAEHLFGYNYQYRNMKQAIYKNFQRIFNPNSFSKEHTQNNVIRPPDPIIQMLALIAQDTSTEDIGLIIRKYFTKFLNNRIGTYLKKDTEVPYIRTNTSDFEIGDMAVEIVGDEEYKWCMIASTVRDDVLDIITKKKPDLEHMETKEVRRETLLAYSAVEKIVQNNNRLESNLSTEELLETYIID